MVNVSIEVYMYMVYIYQHQVIMLTWLILYISNRNTLPHNLVLETYFNIKDVNFELLFSHLQQHPFLITFNISHPQLFRTRHAN